jgi:uncharacterized linocin/CFP29 family protein
LASVRNAAKLLLTAHYPPPYDLILQPSAYMDALTLIANTGISQLEKIKEIIRGEIFVSAILKASDAGTDSAILMKSGAENGDLCVAQDFKTFYMQTMDMNHHFKAYEAVVPRIKRPKAICEITGIT